MCELSSSTSPIACTRRLSLDTRVLSPRPVVPLSPVRVAIWVRRLPMFGPPRVCLPWIVRYGRATAMYRGQRRRKSAGRWRAVLGCNGQSFHFRSNLDECETTTAPQLRNLQRGAVRHLGAGRPSPGPRPDRHPRPDVPTAPAPCGAMPPNRWTRQTSPRPSAIDSARRHSAARKLALAGLSPLRSDRRQQDGSSPAPSSTKRSSSATGPTRIAAFAACARQPAPHRAGLEHPCQRPGSPPHCRRVAGAQTRRRRTAAPVSRPARRRRCQRALDRSADPRSLRPGRHRQQRRTHPRRSAAPGDPAAQLRGDGPEQGRRAVRAANTKTRSALDR